MADELFMPPQPEFQPLLAKCFVSIPFEMLRRHLDEVVRHRVRPEIVLESPVFYDVKRRDFAAVAERLISEGLACTIHAPFADLAPGAADPFIRRATVDKLKRALQLVELFQPVTVVCHLNFEPHKHSYHPELWLENAAETWRQLLPLIRGQRTALLLENTYETDPEMHQRLFTELAEPGLGFCLDVGHLGAFGGSDWRDWLPLLSPWLGQLHLHDNHGDRDEHLPVGRGGFDFQGLFAHLKKRGQHPLLTLEPHTANGLTESLEAIAAMGLFDEISPAAPSAKGSRSSR